MQTKTWKGWGTMELDLLEELRMEGLTAKAIAIRLGRTEASVKCRLAQEQITKPRSSRWIDALSVPHTIAGVAKALGVTKWAVKQAKRKLRRAGIKIPPAEQCRAAGVACFVKQAGAHVVIDHDMTVAHTCPEEQCWPRGTKTDFHRVLLKDPKGGDLAEWPEDLRVREFPKEFKEVLEG